MSPLWYPHVKEAPLQGLTGMWGGVGSNLVAGGSAVPDGDYTAGAFMIWDPSELGYTEGQGTISDISGNSRTGALNNQLDQYWQSDNYGVFNNTSPRTGYISNNQGSCSIPFTLELWAKPQTTGNEGLWDTAPNQVDTGRQNPGGKAEWWNQNPNIDMSMQANTWAHWCVTYKWNNNDGSTRRIVVYKNGQEIGATSGGQDNSFVWDTYCIGTYNYSSPWGGHIGVTAVYNSELSTAQVQANYNARKHRYGL